MQKIGFCERYMLTTAVLNRTKELTRRVEKGLQRGIAEYEKMYHETFNFNTEYQSWGSTINKLVVGTPHATIYVPTRYKLGEVVAVAQSYKDLGYTKEWVDRHISPNPNAKWNDPFEKIYPGWSNKMFVPAELNKAHQIKITGVRIERLQAISEDDCLKEGVYYDADVDGYKVYNLTLPNKGFKGDCFRQKYFKTPREAFASLINRPGVGRKGLWEENPFVVVYEFKLIK